MRQARLLLKVALILGIFLIPIGPLARLSNEGVSELPGPIQVSNYWQRVSYILMSVGIGIALISAVMLVIIDCKQ